MTIRDLRSNLFAPVVGIALVAGIVLAATTYQELERKARVEDAYAATLDRLYHDVVLSVALQKMRAGQAEAAAGRLDQLLCADIVLSDSELANADAREQEAGREAFRRIALIRPKLAAGSPGESAQDCTEQQIAAERILRNALGAAVNAKAK
jgi:hypothetical protein